jgi:hypothetical protein
MNEKVMRKADLPFDLEAMARVLLSMVGLMALVRMRRDMMCVYVKDAREGEERLDGREDVRVEREEWSGEEYEWKKKKKREKRERKGRE